MGRSVQPGLLVVLEIERLALGEEHSSTLLTKRCLANNQLARGHKEKAIEAYHGIIKGQEARLGVDHPETMSTKFQLAKALKKTGRRSEALTVYEEVLQSRTAVLGENHPKTRETKENILALESMLKIKGCCYIC
jgi:hypothetical protein